ncbi:MAG: alpha/beta hydrolase family protein [Sphingomonas sp.]
MPKATLALLLALSAAALGTAGAAMTSDPKPLLTWPDLLSRARPVPNTTISYGDDAYQKVDLWLPTGHGPHPVVLMVHGGCWQTEIADRTLMNWVANDLRTRGIAVWNIDYRGVDRPGGGYPGTFADTAAAADLLSARAADFNLDTRRVVAIGHSAGGHLALWLAARRGLPASSVLYRAHPLPIAHAISLGGLPDLEAVANSPDNGCGTDVIKRLVGTPSATHRNVFRDTSVTRLLPIRVSQTLINGDNDKIIPIRLGTSYVEKAAAAGDSATLIRLPQTGHVELIAPESAAWAATRTAIDKALAQ